MSSVHQCDPLPTAGHVGRTGGTVRSQYPKLGIGHDDPDITPQDKLRYDACITVGPNSKVKAK